MFFFGIFGIESKTKEIRSFNNITCKGCGRLGSYKLYKKYTYFHFFFIPLFKWGYEYFAVSRCCNSVFKISNAKGKKLENGEEDYISDSDLRYQYSQQAYGIRCSSCGRTVEGSFSFCPHCGNKL